MPIQHKDTKTTTSKRVFFQQIFVLGSESRLLGGFGFEHGLTSRWRSRSPSPARRRPRRSPVQPPMMRRFARRRELWVSLLFISSGPCEQCEGTANIPGDPMSEKGRVPRTRCLSTVARCCTRDEGRSLGAGSQVQASNHCKLLSLRAMVVSVAEKSGR